MGVNVTNPNYVAYGLNNPLQTLAPQPIIALRNPTVNDRAEIGTVWVNTATPASYMLIQLSPAVVWHAL